MVADREGGQRQGAVKRSVAWRISDDRSPPQAIWDKASSSLFKRQADDAALSRAEALRQAMMELIDDKGYTDGQGRFAYAHPLFWAPYTIIGDGGGR